MQASHGRQPHEVAERLCGAIAFPITPYDRRGAVDLEAVRANASWLPDSGICAIAAPSGTGELYSLTPRECLEITRATVAAVAGRVPVVAGVGFNASIGGELAREAQHNGADCILILPPYYAQPDEDGLADYYRSIAAATDLGVVVYARDSAAFTPDFLEKLAREIDNLVAFKDGRGDVRLFQRLRNRLMERFDPGRLVWLAGVGDDLAGPYFASGAEGYTSSIACFWPEASVDLFRLASGQDRAALDGFQSRIVHPIYELRQIRKGYEVSIMKAAMEELGHPAGPPRPPLGQVSAEVRARLRSLLHDLGVPDAATRASASAAAPLAGLLPEVSD